jgi:outer membrane protein assembly factor BamB
LRVLAGIGVGGVAGCRGGGDTTDVGTESAGTTDVGTTTAETTTTTPPSDDWPTFRYDNRNTGFNPAATGPTETPSPEWQEDGFFEAHPIVVDGTLYIGGDSSVQALDAETGEQQWTYEVGDKVRSAPAYADGTVVFNGWDGAIYALSADDGSEEWVRTESSVSGEPFEVRPFLETGAVTIEDGTVYKAGLTNRRDGFFALDLASGETEFVIDSTPDDDQNPWETDEAYFITAPAISDGMAYVVDDSGWVYGIDIEAGTISWSSDPSDENGGRGSATVVDDTVYFANFGNNNPDQALYALDAASGEVQWSYEIGPSENWNEVEAATAFAHGAVLIGHSRGQLHAVEPDGTERWTFDTDSPVYSAASADSEHVYVGTFSAATLYAIDPETGEEVWSVSGNENGIGRDIDTPPVVYEETVYVNSERGPLVALR